MKKIVGILLALVMVLSVVSAFAASEIIVISREEGSGTRGAFVELTGVETKEAGDQTYIEAIIESGTAAVITTVESTPTAIGYISLGSLNDTVKALQVEGVDATVENILSGDYVLARPFNIATKGDVSPLVADFIAFIFSEEAQALVMEEGYISQGFSEYTPADVEGKITVGGSTSVYPLMQKFEEAYEALKGGKVDVEVQGGGSTVGMTGAKDGTFDVGMASRELKDSELEVLTPYVVAMDGIAVIVNNENEVNSLTMEQIKSIFIGETTDWAAVME
ncbi:MAG TPA: substrate-binding domain-containing protein [Candidatus Limiplasma sp.]|nr:substrate-binding domain-containing protein [Candidatus Limiplasma sp.]HRX08392.1 substrate-binding domain-containing protein [Candidatus Limiplasma sp.]